MWSCRVTSELCKASGTNLALFQAIFRCSVPISDWICENGAKDSPFSLYDFTKLLGRFPAMWSGKKKKKESNEREING